MRADKQTKARVVKVNESGAIKLAIKVLKQGGVIVYPTETCYGIGCDFENEEAKERIYEVKERPKEKKFIVIVDSLKTARRYFKLDEKSMLIVRALVKRFMPGPLTLAVSENFAFRISSHPFALALTRKFKKPIVSTSANLSGRQPIYEIGKILNTFCKKVDLIVDGGDLPRRKPSTVFDVRKLRAVREGEIREKEIVKFLKNKRLI